MDISRFTQKTQEALAEAQNIAVSYGHQEVDNEHLLLAFLKQEGGLFSQIVAKNECPNR